PEMQTSVPGGAEYLDIPSGTDALDWLNKWIQENPNKRIISLDGILQYRSGVRGFEIVTEPGNNTNQHCEMVAAYDTKDSSGVMDYGGPELQAWQAGHPERHIVAITSNPNYNGGIDGYFVCSESNQ